MSLDVYLETGEETEGRCERCATCFECNGTGRVTHGRPRVYQANITHNLNNMADAAGIYQHLWRPDEIGVTKAAQLIEPLKAGLAKLEADPKKYSAYDSPNGWGRYVNFVPWVRSYLQACIDNPEADVRVCR